MASPQSTTTDDAGSRKHEQITFRFCSECSNMLYPKEDEDQRKLQFTCRTCQYTEDAQSTCVFRNVLNSSSGETAGVTQDVASDPTVSDASNPVICLGCGLVVYCGTCGVPFIRGPEDGFKDSLWALSLFQSDLPPSSNGSEDMFEDDVELSDLSDHEEEADSPRTSLGCQDLCKEEPEPCSAA
ncbi:DNA directed RNA polymerase 2 [Trichoderma aethiopicum]